MALADAGLALGGLLHGPDAEDLAGHAQALVQDRTREGGVEDVLLDAGELEGRVRRVDVAEHLQHVLVVDVDVGRRLVLDFDVVGLEEGQEVGVEALDLGEVDQDVGIGRRDRGRHLVDVDAVGVLGHVGDAAQQGHGGTELDLGLHVLLGIAGRRVLLVLGVGDVDLLGVVDVVQGEQPEGDERDDAELAGDVLDAGSLGTHGKLLETGTKPEFFRSTKR